MSDLISREAAWAEIKKVPLIQPDRMAFKLQQALWDVPAVDAVPVVHGEWEMTSYNAFMVRCSNCKSGDHIHLSEKDIFNFCSNCGAKMDGGKCNG